MVFYEVTLQVDPGVAARLEDFMRQTHIPVIFRTGCFRKIRFDKASAARFRTSYQADTRADLDRYVKDHAPELRADFQKHFPSGVVLTREVWQQQESWS